MFLTNNFELPASVIAELYHNRWNIELFFKWLKQHLKIKKFWGTSENAVRIQIYCAVITYCLIICVKHNMKLERSVYEILQIRGYYGVKQSRNKSKEIHVIALIHRYFIDLISFIFLTVKNLFLVHFCCTFVTRNKIIFITLTSEKPEWGHKIETNKSI